MNYVIGDIHNELEKLKSILKQIELKPDDELIVLVVYWWNKLTSIHTYTIILLLQYRGKKNG